ncbi:hypothetical protein WN944_004397 [Citrus x changshan-huyou]|uniref:Uncharacterized protein n=1 Tax=Citrus x changshan-huyou TaxID=2935761 RepID=A0AAP0M3W1_9ROSI
MTKVNGGRPTYAGWELLGFQNAAFTRLFSFVDSDKTVQKATSAEYSRNKTIEFHLLVSQSLANFLLLEGTSFGGRV